MSLLSAGQTYAGVAVTPDGMHAWVAACVDEDQVVFRTADFGATWLACTLNTVRLFSDICFTDTLTGWTCGQASDIQHTTDGGLTWFRQDLGGAKAASRVRFYDSLFGWVVGSYGPTKRTCDGGDSWDLVWWLGGLAPQDSCRFRGVAMPSRERIWLAAGRIANGDTFRRGQGYVAHSTNGGDSWTISLHDTVNDFYDVAFTDLLHGVVVGGEDSLMSGAVLFTADGGGTWEHATPTPGTPFLRGVCFADAVHGWACGHNGSVVRTTDGGATWGWPHMVPGYNLNDIEFADTLRGMACGDSLVIVTTDGGLTWSRTLGVGEGTGHERRGTSGATIVRGVLDISSTFDCRFPIALRDISGRNVMELRPGANDVRQLPAGVYFVVTPHPCPLPQGARGPGRRMANGEGRMANAKVVIQR